MPKETLEETEKQRQKALEAQKKHGIGKFQGFPFLMPERLKKLQEQVEQQQIEESELEQQEIEETEKQQIKERARRLLDRIEHELLKLEFESASWVYIREELAELSKVADDFAVAFLTNSEDFYSIIFYRIENGQLLAWKNESVSFPEKLAKGDFNGRRKNLRGLQTRKSRVLQTFQRLQV